MPFFIQEGEAKPTDPLHVQAAEEHLSDGKPGGAFTYLLVMAAGAGLFFMASPLVGIPVFLLGGLGCLASMPRFIRWMAFAGAVLGIIGVLVFDFAG